MSPRPRASEQLMVQSPPGQGLRQPLEEGSACRHSPMGLSEGILSSKEGILSSKGARRPASRSGQLKRRTVTRL